MSQQRETLSYYGEEWLGPRAQRATPCNVAFENTYVEATTPRLSTTQSDNA